VEAALAAVEVTVNWIKGLWRRVGATRSVWRRHELAGDGMQGQC
jgi:hypothetical protein